MKRLPFYTLVCYFVLLYTQGMWYGLGVPKMIVDGALIGLPVAALASQWRFLGRPAPGFLFVWSYVGWSLSACIFHDEGIIRGLLYARYLIAAYIVFWAAWNSRFTRGQLLGMNVVILTVFFLQVPASLFNYMVSGEKIEAVVGAMTRGTGGIAAVFPVFAFSCMLAFFLYYNKALFLVAGFSFFLVSYTSGKLAVYYYIPLMLILGLILYGVAEGVSAALRRSRVLVLFAACALPFLVFLLSHTERAENLQDEPGLYNKLVSFLHYTQRMEMGGHSWYTTTRSATSLRVIEETFRREPTVFLFGQGTDVFRFMSGQAEEGAYDKYGIIYGTVGWSYDALAVGWPAMFAHVGFYGYLLSLLLKNKLRGTLTTHWKAIRLAVQLGFGVFLLVYFTYSTHFTVNGWLSSVYLYFHGVLLAPQYQEVLCAPRTASDPDTSRAARRVWMGEAVCPAWRGEELSAGHLS